MAKNVISALFCALLDIDLFLVKVYNDAEKHTYVIKKFRFLFVG